MNCLEFKRLALSEPDSKQPSFVEHSESCTQCLRYVASIRRMDAELASSLNVVIPSDFSARLMLNSEMSDETNNHGIVSSGVFHFSKYKHWTQYAVAASVVMAVFVAGLMLRSTNLNHQQQVSGDYQQLLAGVLEHINEQPITPVWDTQLAHKRVNAILTSNDQGVQIKDLEKLQFGRICPMGQYHGLHATLESAGTQTTFAYIKGESVSDLFDSSYAGYITRVKPVKGGTLIIFSQSQHALDQADKSIKEALVWDI